MSSANPNAAPSYSSRPETGRARAHRLQIWRFMRRFLMGLEGARASARRLLEAGLEDCPPTPGTDLDEDSRWWNVAEDVRWILTSLDLGHSMVEGEVPPQCWSRARVQKLHERARRDPALLEAEEDGLDPEALPKAG